MSMQNENDGAPNNAGYGSADETSSLLVIATTNNNTIIATSTTTNTPHLCQATKMSSINGPTGSKPVLMRQDRTSTYLTSPNLSQTIGYSEESGQSNEDSENIANSITDLDIQYNRLETPVISISNVCQGSASGSSGGLGSGQNSINYGHRSSISGYQLTPHNRCRACRSCDRRASTTPVSSLHLARSVSKESVRSHLTGHGFLSPSSSTSMQSQRIPPPVLITGSPVSGSRIIRQSSQPEASNIICCSAHTTCIHSQTAPTVSLRQLRTEPSSDIGIAGIAADSLRINGAMRPFKQVNTKYFTFFFICI